MTVLDEADAARARHGAPSPDGSWRRPWGLLEHHDFRLLFIGETTSELGNSVKGVSLSLVAVTVLHASTFMVSLLIACAWLPWLVIGLPAGAWVDRLRRRRIMLSCDALSLLIFAGIPIADWCGALDIAELVVAALVAGVATVFFETSYGVYLTSLVETTELAEGTAKLQGAASATQVGGPGFAGLIAEVFGAVTGLLVNAVSFGVSACCLLLIRSHEPAIRPAPHDGAPRPSLIREVAVGARFVAHDRCLMVFTVFGALANLGLTGYQAVQAVFLVRDLGISAGMYGTLMAVGSCGGIAGAFVARRVATRIGSARAVILFGIGATQAGLLIPLTGRGAGLLCYVVGSFVVIASVVAGNIVRSGWLPSYCPRELLGRVGVTMKFLNYGAVPLGALLGGVIGSAYGARTALWMMTGMLSASVIVLLLGPLRRARELPTGPMPDQPAG